MPDAMRQMPSRAVRSYVEFALKLKRGDALLSRAEQGKGHQPFPQRNMAILKNCADRNGELFMAVVALEQAGPVRLPLQTRQIFDRAAVRADWAVGPQDPLDRFTRLIFGKGGNLIERQHGGSLSALPMR